MRALLRNLLLAALIMAVATHAVQAAAITSGGPTQDFPSGGSSKFSAAEPVKAAITWVSPATAVGVASALATARWSISLTDGTRDRCVSIRSRDNQTTTAARRNAFTNQLVSVFAAGTDSAAGAMSRSSLGTDRLTGSWGTFPPSAWLANVLLIGGSDCLAYVGDFTGSSSQNGTTVVDATSDPSFAFDWNLLFTISRGTDFGGTAGANAIITIGVCTWDGSALTQGCITFSDEDALGAPTSRCGGKLDTSRVAVMQTMGAPTEGDSAEITTHSAVGFTATKRGNNGTAPVIGFLALKLSNLQGLKLYSRATKSTTGDDVSTDAGFCMQALVTLFTQLQSINSFDTGTDAGTFGLGAATATGEQLSAAYGSQDNVGTSAAKSMTSDVIIEDPIAPATAGIKGSLSSFDATGRTINYPATVQNPGRQVLELAIGRSQIMAASKGTSTGLGKAAAKAAHAGAAKAAADVNPKAVAKATHSARSKAVTSAITKAVAISAHLGRSNAVSVGAVKAASKTAHAGRSSAMVSAAMKAVAKTSHAGLAKVIAAVAPKAVAKVQHSGRSTAGVEATTKAVATSAHAGLSKVIAAPTSKAVATTAHKGQAKAGADAAPLAVATSRHGGRANVASTTNPKAQAKATHAATAKASTTPTGEATASATHLGRSKVQGVAAGKAVAKVTVSGGGGTAQLGKGIGASASVGRGQATVAHAPRAAGSIHALAKAAAKNAAAGKAIVVSGGHAVARARKDAHGTARATAESLAMARVSTPSTSSNHFAEQIIVVKSQTTTTVKRAQRTATVQRKSETIIVPRELS